MTILLNQGNLNILFIFNFGICLFWLMSFFIALTIMAITITFFFIMLTIIIYIINDVFGLIKANVYNKQVILLFKFQLTTLSYDLTPLSITSFVPFTNLSK